MEYQVCQRVDFTELKISCRGGMAGMCWPYEITDERQVCGEWRTNPDDAYASFYTVLRSATDCNAPGTSCSSATPVGDPAVRTNESGALKAVGAGEKSVGDSILGVFKSIWESFMEASRLMAEDPPLTWD